MLIKLSVIPMFVILSARHISSLRTLHPNMYTSELERILQRHNIYRECHDAPPLELDGYLNEEAQLCANTLATEQIEPRSRGTNLFRDYFEARIDSDEDVGSFGAKAVDQWYQEHSEYPDRRASNFSQLVWKESQKLGVGIAQADDGQVFLCCRYEPAGNVPGLYDENVAYSRRSDDSRIENCLHSSSLNAVADAGSLERINRFPIYLFAQVKNNTKAGASLSVSANVGGHGGDPALNASGGAVIDLQANKSVSLSPECAGNASLSVDLGVNCTGPNCSFGVNDTRHPMLNALKYEIREVVTDESKDMHHMMKMCIITCIGNIVVVVINLIISVVVLIEVTKKRSDDCCSTTGDNTPCEDPRYGKNLAGASSVSQSLQSYM